MVYCVIPFYFSSSITHQIISASHDIDENILPQIFLEFIILRIGKRIRSFNFFIYLLVQFNFTVLMMTWDLSRLLNTISNTLMHWLFQPRGSEWDLIATCWQQINCMIEFLIKESTILNFWIYKSVVMKKTAGIIELQAEFIKDEGENFILFSHSGMHFTITVY